MFIKQGSDAFQAKPYHFQFNMSLVSSRHRNKFDIYLARADSVLMSGNSKNICLHALLPRMQIFQSNEDANPVDAFSDFYL